MADGRENWHPRIPELEERVRELKNLVRYMANTLHQNYHPDGCGWRTCDKPLCYEAQRGLGLKRPMKEVGDG